MSDSSVRIEGDVKTEFDKLQGFLQAETGERVSQSELLRRLLAVARRHEAELMGTAWSWRPPTREQLAKMKARLEPWGEPTDASKIDEALYEDDSP